MIPRVGDRWRGRVVCAVWRTPGGVYVAVDGCGLPTFIPNPEDTTTMDHTTEPEAVALLRAAAPLLAAGARRGYDDMLDVHTAVHAYLARRDDAAVRLRDTAADDGPGWTPGPMLGDRTVQTFWRHTGARQLGPDDRLRDFFDVRVVVADLAALPDGAALVLSDCHGSAVDHAAGDAPAAQAPALCWLALAQLRDAYADPSDWWAAAVGDPDDLGTPAGLARVADTLDQLRWAQAHGAAIEAHADAIAAAVD